jgi:hypothetical protein
MLEEHEAAQVHEGDLERVEGAIIQLRQARDLLHKAGATKALEKVRRALKSAEGARRHTSRLELGPEGEARRG